MILVTGGTGLVGAHLLYQLSLENESVRAIYRKSSNLEAVKNIFSYYTKDFEILFSKINWIEADILDIYSLEAAFKDVTIVYHAAALVSFNSKDYKAMRKINIEGTSNIVNFCIDKKVTKLCYVSSVATLEKQPNKPNIDEIGDFTTEKLNHGYAITKFGAEMEVWRASQEGVPVIIVNPGVILGEGFWDKGTGAIFSKIYHGLIFYTEGITGFVSVTDVVKIMMVLTKSELKNERYILVSENISFKSLFSQIALSFGKKPPTVKVSKLMSEIGWRMEYIWCFITNKNPKFTRQTAASIHKKHLYAAEKLKTALTYKFEPISNTIARVCKFYKRDLKK